MFLVVIQKCNEPETWAKVGFAYAKKFNQNTMSMKQTLVGPNSKVTVYDTPFNEKNLKTLFEKRINDNISFVVKDSRIARDLRDASSIASKILELLHNQKDKSHNRLQELILNQVIFMD